MITANTWFKTEWKSWENGAIKRLCEKFQVPVPKEFASEKPLTAECIRGAWIIRCPDCKGAEYAWEEGMFFCCSCLNNNVGHKLRRASFPPKRVVIDFLLQVRPLNNRNFKPGETIEQLESENKEHAAELLPITAEGGK